MCMSSAGVYNNIIGRRSRPHCFCSVSADSLSVSGILTCTQELRVSCCSQIELVLLNALCSSRLSTRLSETKLQQELTSPPIGLMTA